MLPSELRRTLDVALHDLKSAISLTLTTLSADSVDLRNLLNTALAAGRKNGAQLIEIRLPIRDYPCLGMRFRNIPITDSSDSGVLRLQFEPSTRYASFEVAA